MSGFCSSPYLSIAEPIIERAKTVPDQLGVIFIDADKSEEKISIGQLHAKACSYAAKLLSLGIRPGDIVIIALRHCQDLIYAFWGAAYAGAIPSIFVYWGPMTTSESYLVRLKAMIQRACPKVVITFPDFEEHMEDCLSGLAGKVLTPEGVGDGRTDHGVFGQQATSEEQVAYLQYTSGTTGMQKGVMLSHRAILNFAKSFAKAAVLDERRDVIVNWLPLYHDFGLFAGLISPLCWGIPAVLLSPFAWLRRPKVLLWAIHNHRGTISFLPNSAHNHTVRNVFDRDLEGLDLSTLRMLINGAEPVLYETQNLFLKRFASCGLKETALITAYGMAENTLGVTIGTAGVRSPVDWVSAKEMHVSRKANPVPPNKRGSKANVSSGVPFEGVDVAIIDDRGSRLPARSIGEIIIRGNFLFGGYHNNEDLTRQVMHNGWYHTGDLGYWADGQLYVCGREKDVIIVGGSNIHPEDLEAIAGSIPGVHQDGVVAFGLLDKELGTERIILVCELAHPITGAEKLNLERNIRQRVFRELEVTLGEVHFIGKRWVVKTQNGKLARALNREKYKRTIAGVVSGVAACLRSDS